MFHLSVHLSIRPSTVSACPSICLSIFHLSIHPSIHRYVYLSVYLQYPAVHPSVCPSVHPSIHPYIYPSIYSIRLSMDLSNQPQDISFHACILFLVNIGIHYYLLMFLSIRYLEEDLLTRLDEQKMLKLIFLLELIQNLVIIWVLLNL